MSSKETKDAKDSKESNRGGGQAAPSSATTTVMPKESKHFAFGVARSCPPPLVIRRAGAKSGAKMIASDGDTAMSDASNSRGSMATTDTLRLVSEDEKLFEEVPRKAAVAQSPVIAATVSGESGDAAVDIHLLHNVTNDASILKHLGDYLRHHGTVVPPVIKITRLASRSLVDHLRGERAHASSIEDAEWLEGIIAEQRVAELKLDPDEEQVSNNLRDSHAAVYRLMHLARYLRLDSLYTLCTAAIAAPTIGMSMEQLEKSLSPKPDKSKKKKPSQPQPQPQPQPTTSAKTQAKDHHAKQQVSSSSSNSSSSSSPSSAPAASNSAAAMDCSSS